MAENQAQERDQDVVTYSAFRGVRNDVTAERFIPSDLEVATNCNIDKTGRLSRRAGRTKLITGPIHSVWADDQQTICLYVQGNQLKQYPSGAVLCNLLVGAARMWHAKINDTVYFSNGTDKGVIQNGSVRSWGLTVPPLPAIQVIPGAMPAGMYQFCMTYLREDGQESGAPLAGVIDMPSGGGLLFGLPVSTDPTVARKIVYLSTPNGEAQELFVAFATANSATTAAYTGDTSEFDLPLETQFLSDPPPGQLIAYYRGRAFVAVGDTLYPSEPEAYEQFDLRNYIALDGNITLLAPLEDKEGPGLGMQSGFFVGTDKSCGVLVGGKPEEFQYVPKVPYGAIYGAVDYVDGSVFGDNSLGARMLPMWMSAQGICVGRPNMEIQNLTRTKYGFNAAGQGAAVFMPGPNRFIATANF